MKAEETTFYLRNMPFSLETKAESEDEAKSFARDTVSQTSYWKAETDSTFDTKVVSIENVVIERVSEIEI